MRTKKQAQLLYFIACLLAMFATVIESDSLLLVTKPIVIPAMLFFYLSAKLTKTNPWVLVFMVLSFIGDTVVLLEIPDATLFIMIPYFLSYLILLHFVVTDIKKIPFDRFGVAVGFLIFVLMISVTVMLIQFFSTEQQDLVIPIVIYGILLAVYAGLSVSYFYSTASNTGFYMVISALMCVVSDVFFVLFNLILVFPDFLWFNLGVQLFSYFFITKYFILRKN